MLLMLDPATAFIDPIFDIPTLVLIGDVFDPITRAVLRATRVSSPVAPKPI